MELASPNTMVVEGFSGYRGEAAEVSNAIYHGVSRSEASALL